jgi:DNA polymerase-1
MEQRIFLVDANGFLHRAYHALPPLANSRGEPTGALLGFARMLIALLRREKPPLLAVCFDAPGPTFRHKIFERYKAQRKPADEDLKSQLSLARGLVAAMGLPSAELPGWEADDVIASLARKARIGGFSVVVVSSDKDVLQLVGGPVRVLNESKGALFDEAGVLERLGVPPGRVVDFLALVGDSSDNVPGAPGVGPVGAAKLLKRFGGLDEVLSAAESGHPDIPARTARSLRECSDKVRFGRELVTLDDKAPVVLDPSDCLVRFEPNPGLDAFLRRLEFNSLRGELGFPEDAPPPAPEGACARLIPCGEFLRLAGGLPVGVDAAESGGDWAGASLSLALGLEDGRAGLFQAEDVKRHRSALSALLEGQGPKRGHDLKTLSRLLGRAGLKIRGPAFDCRLAAWCLDSDRKSLDLEAISAERLGRSPAAGDLPARAACLCALAPALESALGEQGLGPVYFDLELPLILILAGMEEAGVAIDAGRLRSLREEFASSLAGVKAAVEALCGCEVNLNSPKQVAELLYGKMGLKPAKKTRGGAASTDEDSLRALSAAHEIPARILEYRELAKLQSTYVEGLLSRVSPSTGRVHTHFDQAGTGTGRLSSLDPNLQNIPVRTPAGQKIRKAFVAPPGALLLSADYSQIELRILAHLSSDEALLSAFASGGDVHRGTAAEVFGVKECEVTPEMRRCAKAVNFGIVYGQTPHGLSRELGISMGEAKAFIEKYFLRYRGVEAWIRSTVEEARRTGFVRTLFGRLRRMPGLSSRNFAERSFFERAAVNTPIQGSAADVIKAAMIALRGARARMILQVHDELIFEVPERELRETGAWVRERMEGAFPLRAPLVVDLKAGKNWGEMEPLA